MKTANRLNEKAQDANSNMEHITELSEQTAAVSEELAATTEEESGHVASIEQASRSLSQKAGELQTVVEQFRI